MSNELIKVAILKYEAESRRMSHPIPKQCYIKGNVIVLRNITGTLATYPIADLLVDEPEEVADAVDSDGIE